MRVVIAAPEKMNVVGRDQTDAQILGDLREDLVALPLLFHAVIV